MSAARRPAPPGTSSDGGVRLSLFHSPWDESGRDVACYISTNGGAYPHAEFSNRTWREAMTGAGAKTPSLSVLEERLSICRLDSTSKSPKWAFDAAFFSLTRASDELSVVCPDESVPDGVTREAGWRAIKLEGPLDLSLVGVLAPILETLAKAGVNVFAISTYETDYVLVKESKLETAIRAMEARGYTVGERG